MSPLAAHKRKRISYTNNFLALKLGTGVTGSPTNLKLKGISQIHFREQFNPLSVWNGLL